MEGAPDPVTVLSQQFPGWTLWLSGTGRWWASRRVELNSADGAAGCVPFLHADDPDTLAGQIRAQHARQCSEWPALGQAAPGRAGDCATLARAAPLSPRI